MALIPVHFSHAPQFPINNSSLTPIPPGQLLKLNVDANGNPQVSAASTTSGVVGLAADGFLTQNITPPASGYAADLVTGANGNTTTRSTNRINDLYRDTAGSGLMTVYTGVGVFRTTQYSTAVTFNLMDRLWSDASGLVTNVAGTGNGADSIGKVVGLPKAFPSGVPGTDIDGSMSLGTYLTIEVRF